MIGILSNSVRVAAREDRWSHTSFPPAAKRAALPEEECQTEGRTGRPTAFALRRILGRG